MSKKIKILFCEDNPNDAELMRLELWKSKVNYLPSLVDTKEGFLRELRGFQPDIILCDYSMPSFTGMDAFKLLKEQNLPIPFIIVTGTLNEELALEFINEGVTDFILKSSFWRVPKAIERAIEKKEAENLIRQNQANLKIIFDNTSEGFILTDENDNVQSFNSKAEEIVFLYKSRKIQIGKSIFDFIGESRKALVQHKNSKVLKGLTIQFDESFKLINGKIAWISFSIDYIRVEGNIKGICITLRDVTELKLVEEKITKTSRMYAMLSQINQTITHVNNDEALYNKACSISINFGKFKIAWIGMFDEANERINIIKECGNASEELQQLANVPFGNDSPQQYVLQTNSFYVSNDIEKDRGLSVMKPFAAKRGIRSCLVLPIKKSGIVIGTFNLYSDEVNFFDTAEIGLLEEVASDISFAIDVFEKEKLRKEAEKELQNSNEQLHLLSFHLQSIREEERTHIAREIHDELGQQLTALKMDIDWIKHKQTVPNKEIETKLQEMLNFSDVIITTIRRISTELRPAIIDNLGLIAALEWKCSEFEEKHGIPCHFASTIIERKFESNFSITVFRILQETLTNVTRHAQAKSVKVLVEENEKELIMEITDDGVGVDNVKINSGKTLGVLGMKERAALMGGELMIKGEKNKGTHSKLIIPFLR